MRKFGPSIPIAYEPQQSLPDKEILWGSQDGGCNYFPMDWAALKERISSDYPVPLSDFMDAIWNAHTRVLIVDEYFLSPKKGNLQTRVDHILSWFPLSLVASDIRILTGSNEEILERDVSAQFQAHAQRINGHSARRETQCAMEIKTHLRGPSAFIHDRFAIIDHELWHFGGTVGGFQASVSAATRGWNASDCGAIVFFNMVWNQGVGK